MLKIYSIYTCPPIARAHKVEMVKRIPYYAFPSIWNNALCNKYNKKHHI